MTQDTEVSLLDLTFKLRFLVYLTHIVKNIWKSISNPIFLSLLSDLIDNIFSIIFMIHVVALNIWIVSL